MLCELSEENMENHVSTCEGNYESVQVTQNYRCDPETSNHLGGRASHLNVQKQTRQVCSSMKHLQCPQSCVLRISSTRRNWEPLLLHWQCTVFAEKYVVKVTDSVPAHPFFIFQWISGQTQNDCHSTLSIFTGFSAVCIFPERQSIVKRKEIKHSHHDCQQTCVMLFTKCLEHWCIHWVHGIKSTLKGTALIRIKQCYGKIHSVRQLWSHCINRAGSTNIVLLTDNVWLWHVWAIILRQFVIVKESRKLTVPLTTHLLLVPRLKKE